jgi:hypothetical protein
MMKQHRSKHALSLRFNQHDYLPTIIEGQPMVIGIIASSEKLPLPIICQSSREDWHVEDNTSKDYSTVMKVVGVARPSDVVRQSFVTATASNPASGKEASSSNHLTIKQILFPYPWSDANHKIQISHFFRARLIEQRPLHSSL